MIRTMDATKQALLDRIEADKPIIIDFLQGFIRCKSPNPPGDTREAAAHVQAFLRQHRLAYRVVAPNERMPNIVGTFDCALPGRHLALNGHMDVFPVDPVGWTAKSMVAALAT
jgi:succinyl-diaminopimelate desuccinylase